MTFYDFIHRSRRLGPLSSFACGSPTEQRIMAAKLEQYPYPYFVADNVLPAETTAAMLAHWPSRSDFSPEIAHNYVCNLLKNQIADRAKRSYWAEFVKDEGGQLSRATAKQFAPWITALYGPNAEIRFSQVSLMESDPQYAGHGCHTHHYHDPCWVGTILLYLDPAPNGYPGTTINRFRQHDLHQETRMAANTLRWMAEPEIEEFKTVEYRPNRLFAMFDSPISYHSVKAASANAVGNRRVFRIHMTAPEAQVRARYNVSLSRYRAARRQPSTDAVVLEWLRRDIEEMRAVSSN